MNKLYCAEKTWSETFFSEGNKVFSKIFEPNPESKEKGRRGKTNTKLFRGGNVLPSFPYLSVFHPFSLIERENRERSFNFAFDQHLDLDEQLSLGRGVAPPDNARRSMRFHAAFTERELNFKGNSFETSMPAKRAPCLGKTTFVPNTLASAYLSAHLGEALLHLRHPRGGRIERRGGSLATALDISKPDAFEREGAKKGSEEEATKAWKGLGTPPRYAVLIQPARKIDEPPDFLPNHPRSDTCSQLHNFSRQLPSPLSVIRGHSRGWSPREFFFGSGFC